MSSSDGHEYIFRCNFFSANFCKIFYSTKRRSTRIKLCQKKKIGHQPRLRENRKQTELDPSRKAAILKCFWPRLIYQYSHMATSLYG